MKRFELQPLLIPSDEQIALFNPGAGLLLDGTTLLLLPRVVTEESYPNSFIGVCIGHSDGTHLKWLGRLQITARTGNLHRDNFIMHCLKNGEEDASVVQALPGNKVSLVVVGLKDPSYTPDNQALSVYGILDLSSLQFEVTEMLTPEHLLDEGLDDRHVFPWKEWLISRPQRAGGHYGTASDYIDFFDGGPSKVRIQPITAARSAGRVLLASRPDRPWEAMKMGGVGFMLPYSGQRYPTGNMLLFYIGNELEGKEKIYNLGLALVNEQAQVLARTNEPLLTPKDYPELLATYSRDSFGKGRFGARKVIFCRGGWYTNGEYHLAVSINDLVTLLCHIPTVDIDNALEPVS
jgi:predicted GH43/DUF377 family glycosyl hydrolase